METQGVNQFTESAMDALDIEAVRPDVYGASGSGIAGSALDSGAGIVITHRLSPDAAGWNIAQIENLLGQELGLGRGRGKRVVVSKRGRKAPAGQGRQEAEEDENRGSNVDDDSLKQVREDLDLVGKQWLSEIQVCEYWQSDCKYARFSPKIDFNMEDTSGANSVEIHLPLFTSVLAPKKAGTDNMDEFVSHVGGSVWCLDWCPHRPGWKILQRDGVIDKEYLAVGAHPASDARQRRFGEALSDYHKLGEPLYGKALIQIWSYTFPYDSDEISNDESDGTEMDPASVNMHAEQILEEPEDLDTEGMGEGGRRGGRGRGRGRRGRGGGGRGGPKGVSRLKDKARIKRKRSREGEVPKMVLAIAHDGGVSWDVKWQPAEGRNEVSSFQDREFLRLGYLAVALGDGSLQVFDVPLPKIFDVLDTKGSPLVVSMRPVFKCSELRSGGQKSIPLTLEWSTSAPHDLLLAGCHDGTVALWKFSPNSSGEESRPLLFFIADSFALRTIAWAPANSGLEGEHVIATGGHSGHLKFWDLRDPFRPLWELRLSRGQVLSMDWLESPRCILVTLDDGTLRTISLNNALSDTPVTGKPFTGTQAQGVQSYYCSSFAIWDIQVCRRTGYVAYCSADGSVIHFELSEKAVEKGGTRYRLPHYLCGAFGIEKDKRSVVIVSQDFQGPVQMKRSLTEWSFTPRSKRGFTVSVNQEMRASSIAAGLLPPSADSASKKKGKKGKKKGGTSETPVPVEEAEGFPGNFELEESSAREGQALVCKEEILDSVLDTSGKNVQPPNTVEEMPQKVVAVHKVKWNPNKGNAGWVCYGGAAGLIRCRFVSATAS